MSEYSAGMDQVEMQLNHVSKRIQVKKLSYENVEKWVCACVRKLRMRFSELLNFGFFHDWWQSKKIYYTFLVKSS